MSEARRTSRRQRKAPVNLAALAELRQAKMGMTKRSDQLKLEKDQGIFDVVTEEEYKELVRKRRAEDFVVDDGVATGYADDGEEHWDLDSRRSEAQRKSRFDRQEERRLAGKKTQKEVDPVAAEKARLSTLLLSGIQAHQDAELQDTEEQDSEFLESLIGGGKSNGTAHRGRSQEMDLQSAAILGQQSLVEDMVESVPSSSSGAQGGPMDINFEVQEEFDPLAAQEDYTGEGDWEVNSQVSAKPSYVEVDLRGRHAAGAVRQTDFAAMAEEALFMKTPASKLKQAKFGESLDFGDDTLDDFDPQDDEGAFVQDESMEPQDRMEVDLPTVKTEEAAVASTTAPAKPVYDWKAMGATFQEQSADAAARGQGVSPVNPSGEILLYYYDACEHPSRPGCILLFGKALIPSSDKRGYTYESCCVAVENMERQVFVLPRKYHLEDPQDELSVTKEPVEMAQVFEETKQLLKQCGVRRHRCTIEERNFCFGRDLPPGMETNPALTESLLGGTDGVPPRTKYLIVKYSFADQAIPREVKGRTFSHIFGTRSSALELFILDRQLMGPSWLLLRGVEQQEKPMSWCQWNFKVTNPESIVHPENSADIPVPEFKVMSLSLKTRVAPGSSRHEIVMATLLTHDSINIDGPTKNPNFLSRRTIVSRAGNTFPADLQGVLRREQLKATTVGAERSLLNLLVQWIHQSDPDVLVGHDIHGFTIEVLMQRLRHHKLYQNWSKVGRLARHDLPKIRTGTSFQLIDTGVAAGRLVCDTMVGAKELRQETKYTLPHLVDVVLGHRFDMEVDPRTINGYYSSSRRLVELVKLNETEAYLSLELMHKLELLPLTKQLTCLCGNLWMRSLRSARAERVEYLLLHQFHARGFIPPEKYTKRERLAREYQEEEEGLGAGNSLSASKRSKRRKPQYDGGLVLEPKKGFYERYVLVMDFQSLYPSIIREKKICFTTVDHWTPSHLKRYTGKSELAREPPVSAEGILPAVVQVLLDRRKAARTAMTNEPDPGKKQALNVRQLALKLVANSMYGCLGFVNSRFYCEPLAALITSQGRNILMETRAVAEKMGKDPIYGDTDSLMINTNEDDVEEVIKFGRQFRLAINKKYRVLELDLDGVLKNLLLLRKKKYAALKLNLPAFFRGDLKFTQETKGLDLVRRDWCQLSKDIGHQILDTLLGTGLEEMDRDDIIERIQESLRKLRRDVDAGVFPPEKYAITKSLTQNPDQYINADVMPHVQVALRRMANGDLIRAGDIIPYIICLGDTKNLAERAHCPKELQRDPSLKIDYIWYLENQILPPIGRLLEPIDEITQPQIADCLGLDPNKFKPPRDHYEEWTDILVSQDSEEQFRDCEPLKPITCARCRVSFPIHPVYNLEATEARLRTEPPPPAVSAVPIVSALDCPTPDCPGPVVTEQDAKNLTAKIISSLTRQARSLVRALYTGDLVCPDKGCGHRTKDIRLSNPINCPKSTCQELLRPEYPPSSLYTQLLFMASRFDSVRARRTLGAENNRRKKADEDVPELKLELPSSHEKVFNDVHRLFSDAFLERSAYHFVSFADLFQMVDEEKPAGRRRSAVRSLHLSGPGSAKRKR